MLIDIVTNAHRKTIDRIVERGSVERLRKAYERAADEVLRKLSRVGRGSETFTAHHLRGTLAQLKAGQLYINDQLLEELSAASREAQTESLTALMRDYSRLERHYSGVAPDLPIEEAAHFRRVLDQGQPTLLRQHAVSISRFGESLIGTMEDELGLSLLAGETMHAATNRLHDVIGSEWWQAERVVRTEVSYASALTTSHGIAAIAKDDSEVWQQWIELCGPDGQPLDARVGVDSIALHGQCVKPGTPYIVPAEAPYPDARGNTRVPKGLVGKSILVPPSRPNGRETIQVWKKSWGSPGWVYRGGRRVAL